MFKTLIAAISFLLVSVSALAGTQPTEPAPTGLAKATFAAGCFWCVEPPFDKLKGVISTTAGYTDGDVKNPTYRGVSAGRTGHTEGVEVVYDPSIISYETLLQVYWVNVDPTESDRQFCDSGSQYRPGIYWHDEAQRESAEASLQGINQSGRFTRPVVVELKEASTFYAAEDYHQDYYIKNPRRYSYYRWSCGRDSRLKELWGDLKGLQ